jgi:eukaryotic-like serine/threonine-protein kinase
MFERAGPSERVPHGTSQARLVASLDGPRRWPGHAASDTLLFGMSHLAAMRPIGRYVLFGEIASGGMATVHLGRLSGPAGFARTVAIKQLHPQFAKDPEFVSMFLDEARLAGRIQHPNVVPTLDVVVIDNQIFLVMEFVQGASLAKLLRLSRTAGETPDPRLIASIVSGVLHGLHAAHEARGERDEALEIVHRDVSPQNILVGIDGVTRVLDFGVAKAVGRLQTTREGQVKGKFAYMAPEQLSGQPVTRRADIYAAAVVAWEALTAERLFRGDHEAAIVTAVLRAVVPPPSEIAPQIPADLDRVVMRGLDRIALRRYATAHDMAVDLEQSVGLATPAEVGAWVRMLAHEELEERAAQIKEMESVSAQLKDMEKVAAQTQRTSLPNLPADLRATIADVPSRTPSTTDVGEMRTDISSMAVAPSLPPRRPRSRSAFLGGVAGVVALFAVMVGMMLAREHVPATESPATGASVATPALPPVPSVAPAPTPSIVSVSASDLPVATVAATDLPTVPLHEPPALPAWRRRRTHGNGAPAPAPPTPKPAATAPDCDPPYWIDGDGHKRYKPACL